MSKTSVHRIFLGVLALMPAALFAQQAAQPKTKAAQGKTEEPQPKKEEAKKEEARNDEAMKLTQEPQQKTEEDGKLTSVPGSKALGMSILGNQEALGRKQRAPAVRRRMGVRQRRPMWRKGESHEFH